MCGSFHMPNYLIYHEGTGTYFSLDEAQLIEIPSGVTSEDLDDALGSGDIENGERVHAGLNFFDLGQVEHDYYGNRIVYGNPKPKTK